MTGADERKSRSIEILSEMGVQHSEHLPSTYADVDTDLRPAGEVYDRMLGLAAAVGRATLARDGQPHELMEKIFEMSGGEPHLSPDERSFVELADPQEQEWVQFHWRIEGVYTLQWALGLWDEFLEPDELCDMNGVLGLVVERGARESASLRPKSEVLDLLDLYYRLHWACTQARIEGSEDALPVEPGVVMERRYALEWLADTEAEWDAVEMST